MFVPSFDLCGFELKNVDVLSDIRIDETDEIIDVDTIVQIQPQFVDTCKTGIVCVEDYSLQQNALHRFYNALETKNRQVHIAYFGDSFIEGDLLTGALRQLLQKKYGGNGRRGKRRGV